MDHDKIRNLLLGHKVVSVEISDGIGTATLDNGTVLELEGNTGGCSCSVGDYCLTELNTVDNIITDVDFFDDPDVEVYSPGAGYEIVGSGTYKIFVFAYNRQVNFATFEGSDGNGYHGTGYSITVKDYR